MEHDTYRRSPNTWDNQESLEKNRHGSQNRATIGVSGRLFSEEFFGFRNCNSCLYKRTQAE